MQIVFLGTGGGRVNLLSQERSTGGFRINGPIKIHVDPGPGALIFGNKYGQKAADVQLLIVTHNHIDHVNDAGLMIEAMSEYALKKKGRLIASKSVIIGDENGDKGVTNYHLNKLESYAVAEPGVAIGVKIGNASCRIIPVPVRHEDTTGFGFVLEMGGKRIGYTSDTEYFEGIAGHYAGCGILIVNNIKATPDNLKGHMHSAVTAKLLSEAKPALAIITHMGMKLLHAGPEAEAEKISKASGVKTIAAKDGMEFVV
ncbi:MAG: MBL fold metallo-hydrolase [Candidatus Micrarchaeia archaeon]